MKKITIVALLPLFFLASCSGAESSSTRSPQVKSLQVPFIGIATGRIRFIAPAGSYAATISAFNTAIGGSVYYYKGDYTDDQLTKMNDDFSFSFMYLSALSDRHYDYTLDGSPLTNLKTINDSYGTGKAIVVNDWLYDILKKSFTFSCVSEGYFNIFMGEAISDYENLFGNVGSLSSTTALQQALTLSNNFSFASDIPAETLSDFVTATPKTKAEMTSVLTFDDVAKSVTFNEFPPAKALGKKVSLSLSGMAKGEATQLVSNQFTADYPSISMLINSGTSSIKAIGTKPDQKDWNIRYTNPLSREELLDERTYNPYEVALKKNGDFNLSTSGYYEHYYYTYTGQDIYQRRSHIILPSTGLSVSFFDQTSVLLDDSGLADMYTTSLMSTSSVAEALKLFTDLNSHYSEANPSLILCYKSPVNDPTSLYQYRESELSPLGSSSLPIVTLDDGTRYSSDYSDISSSSVKSAVSAPTRSFKETYMVSSDILSNVSLITDTTVAPYQNKMLAVIRSL